MADIAFIIYKTDAILYNELINNLAKLDISKFFSVEYITVEGDEGYSKAYNFGMHNSTARFKFYINESTRLLDSEWIIDVINLFKKNPRIAMIGPSGSVTIPNDGIFIRNNKRSGRIIVGDSEIIWSKINSNEYEDVLLLDNGIFATQYDIDYSFETFRKSFFIGAIKSIDFLKLDMHSVVLGSDKTIVKYTQDNFSINKAEIELFKKEYLHDIITMELRHCVCCDNIIFDYLPLPLYYAIQNIKYHVKYEEPEMLNRRHYLCPVCGAADRDRAYALWMRKNLSHIEKLRILDVAPNTGLSSFIKREFPQADYKSLDLYMHNVDYHLDVMNMNEIPSNYIDFFICSHVLEHVNDDIKAMKEFFRILKVDGCGIMVVPIDINQHEIDEDPKCVDIGERWRRFGQDDHIRKYSSKGFKERLQQVGFVVCEYDKTFFEYEEIYKQGLSYTVKVYIVRK